MSIFARCAAIVQNMERGFKLHLLPGIRSAPPGPVVQRVFGPFFLKHKELIVDVLEIESPNLTPEEFSEMLKLESWGYVELIVSEDGSEVRLERFFPLHLPTSALLRTAVPWKVMRNIYEPHFNDVLAARVEHCVATGQSVTRARITEPEKLLMVLRCSWVGLWDKLTSAFRRTPLF